MQRIIVQMTAEELAALDAEVEEAGLSRAAVVREAVNRYVADERRRRAYDAIVRSYDARPQLDSEYVALPADELDGVLPPWVEQE